MIESGRSRRRVVRTLAAAGVAAGLITLFVGQAGAAEDPPATAAAEREGAIFQRQLTMTQLDKDAELLGRIVAGLAPPEKLAATTRAIAAGAKDAQADFAQKIPGGRTKDAAWTNNADFTQRLDAFARNADLMAKAGESGNVASVTALMIDGLPCKQCHDLYREPKKP